MSEDGSLDKTKMMIKNRDSNSNTNTNEAEDDKKNEKETEGGSFSGGVCEEKKAASGSGSVSGETEWRPWN